MSAPIDRLWAPWRGEWIQNQKDPLRGCPFCELPCEEPSEENLVLYRDEWIFVVMNKFPYNPGHLMVIPRAHVGRPEDLPADTWSRLAKAVRLCTERLKGDSNPAGFNLGMNLGAAGGAGIPDHLHWHVLPRWNGDTNFMPLLAEAKALPFHNVTIYRRLKPLFEGFGQALGA